MFTRHDALRFRMFRITYLPLTEKSPRRIRIEDTWREECRVIKYDYEANINLVDQALSFLQKDCGIEVAAITYDQKRGIDYILSADFATSIKKKGS